MFSLYNRFLPVRISWWLGHHTWIKWTRVQILVSFSVGYFPLVEVLTYFGKFIFKTSLSCKVMLWSYKVLFLPFLLPRGLVSQYIRACKAICSPVRRWNIGFKMVFSAPNIWWAVRPAADRRWPGSMHNSVHIQNFLGLLQRRRLTPAAPVTAAQME